MLDWLLKDEVQKSVDAFCYAQEREIGEDRLTISDWETIANIRDFLRSFFLLTKETEGNTATLGLILPAIDHLMQEFEDNEILYREAGDEHMVGCLDAGWKKMKKYYLKTGRSAAYIAATVLDPTCKWVYFESAWEANWVRTGKKQLVDFWKAHYQSKAVCIPTALPAEKPELSVLKRWKKSHLPAQSDSSIDELDLYLSSSVLGDTAIENALDWWLEPAQRRTFPNLSIMAIDLLSIPAKRTSNESNGR